MVVGERDAVEVAGGGWVATPQQIRSGISSTVKTASALCGRPICAPVIDRVEEVELGVLVGGDDRDGAVVAAAVGFAGRGHVRERGGCRCRGGAGWPRQRATRQGPWTLEQRPSRRTDECSACHNLQTAPQLSRSGISRELKTVTSKSAGRSDQSLPRRSPEISPFMDSHPLLIYQSIYRTYKSTNQSTGHIDIFSETPVGSPYVINAEDICSQQYGVIDNVKIQAFNLETEWKCENVKIQAFNL